jgi:hypothetical protein
MGLIKKLMLDTVRSHDGVVRGARADFERELRRFATGPFSLGLYRLADAKQGNVGLGGTTVEIDRALYGVVPTGLGPLEVVLPFSAKDTLAAQFALELDVPTPLGVKLERGLFGKYSDGNWAPIVGTEQTDPKHPLVKTLDRARVSSDLIWDSTITGGYKMKLGWCARITPLANGRSRLTFQTGISEFLMSRTYGVMSVYRAIERTKNVLQDPAFHGLRAAAPLPGFSLGDRLRDGVKKGVLTAASSSSVAVAPTSSAESKGDLKAIWSAVLGLLSIPMMWCLPLPFVAAALAWTSRKRAIAEGRKVPVSAHIGLASSVLALTLLLGSSIAAFAVPEAREARAKTASSHRIDASPAPTEHKVASDETRPAPRKSGTGTVKR